MDAATDVGDV